VQHAENTASAEPGEISSDRAILIYDGECPVCGKAVEWVTERALPDAFEFLSCHSETLPGRFPAIDKAACLQAMHLVLSDGTVLAGERAIPEILRRLRGYRWATALFRLPGAGMFSRVFYRWFATNRFHISKALFRSER
jgi:predicted DCC family thiol-disulfide oxidoreductase YuxK